MRRIWASRVRLSHLRIRLQSPLNIPKLGGRATPAVVLSIVLACTLCVMFVCGSAVLGAQAQSPMLTSQCTFSLLSGAAAVQMPGSDRWQQANDGIVLQAGSKVTTAADSYALLTFFEGSTIKLQPNTEIEIQTLQKVDASRTEIVLKQWVGKTWSRVIKMGDTGSRYEIETPAAVALVRGTLFETEVSDSGSTIVRTTQGLVRVGAQNGEVDLPPGQQAGVEFGLAPSQPAPIPPPDNKLVITVNKPAVASVCDPTGSSTGYLTSGIGFNQILGSKSSPIDDGTQVITIPDPVSGEYSIVLRCIADGTIQLDLGGFSGGQTVFEQTRVSKVSAGSEWIIKVNLKFDDVHLIGAITGIIEPLRDQAPENIVITEHAKTSAVPIGMPLDNKDNAANASQNGQDKAATASQNGQDKAATASQNGQGQANPPASPPGQDNATPPGQGQASPPASPPGQDKKAT
jgi:hypothetical protein